MAQVGASPTSARPGWSDPGKHKYKPIAKLRTMREM
ncbi:rCG27556 [Rattus norvegicus]|uniref:RCG27556 n=2 Tax=Murinae TaxID=39107 RepID=A6K7A5_RAT|nr:rCG27556 [Rattus norvegicus]